MVGANLQCSLPLWSLVECRYSVYWSQPIQLMNNVSQYVCVQQGPEKKVCTFLKCANVNIDGNHPT